MKKELLDIVTLMSHSPVRQYVTPGLTSLLVGGEGHGNVRLFTSDRDTREWITPHSHRFDFVCMVLEGDVENVLFVPGRSKSNTYSRGSMRRINAGMGNYEITRDGGVDEYEEHRTIYSVGESYSMKASEIHSIRFSRGARVLFLEGPEVSDASVFLEPFSDGETIQTFETRPWMFKRSK